MPHGPRLVTVAGAAALVVGCSAAGLTSRRDRDADWPVTGGEPGNSRFSALTQIDRDNVRGLQVAWIYRTGDASARSQIQATPVVVDGVLYATSPMLRVFALRADTGEELWRFDPTNGAGQPGGANRGVAYWADGEDRRILFTANRRLYALDAATGRPIPSFGQGGWVDLAAGLGREIGDPTAPGVNPFGSQMLIATSPGVVYGDLLIQGTRVSEGEGALPGHVRAFDVRTGEVRWIFHTIPRPGEYGSDSWPAGAERWAGGANSWPGMTVDVRRGIVFVPTGSASPDFWGGDRPGANLFANSLVALDARTGRRIWHFQTVHHDLWDRDLPAAPSLVTVRHQGRLVDAVAQITKQGFVFVFDRETGEPLFPVEERPVPTSSSVPGQHVWPTQPFPVKPAPFARQLFTADSVTDLSPESRAFVLERFRRLRQPAVLFAPLGLEGTIIFPGFDGGGEWGGAAADPRTGVLYVNASDVPWIGGLAPARVSAAPRSGAEVYAGSCAGCHGPDRAGDGSRSPSLVDVGARLTAAQIRQVIDHGRGFMPSFAALPAAERDAVTRYLLGRPDAPAAGHEGAAPAARAGRAGTPGAGRVESRPAPYTFTGYERWQDQNGLPAVKPPWGTLSAIDLNTGEYRWRIPLGEHPALAGRGLPPTGTEQYGGPIVTAGGVVFIGATMDEKFRAVDASTGEILWEARLPAAGYATPSTYMVNGRQYVVIAAGGGKLGTKPGDAYVAFALPDPREHAATGR